MNAEPWVTAIDVARHLGVVKDTVYRWRESRGQPMQRLAAFPEAGHVAVAGGVLRWRGPAPGDQPFLDRVFHQVFGGGFNSHLLFSR